MISVIIPVFNASDFLASSVNSVLEIDKVKEILLIDDGSTDNSLEICHKLKELDKRIKVFTHQERKNKGAAESRNLGIKMAKFPYIAFLDSDDFYFKNRFDEAITILENNPQIDGCYGKVVLNFIDQEWSKSMGPPTNLSAKKLFSFLLNGGYFHTNSVTVRKSFLDKIGGFNQSCWPHEDVELWIRMAFHGSIQSIVDPSPIAEYRIHGKNLSHIANFKSKWFLWSTVFKLYFFKKISFLERLYILKQIIKVIASR